VCVCLCVCLCVCVCVNLCDLQCNCADSTQVWMIAGDGMKLLIPTPAGSVGTALHGPRALHSSHLLASCLLIFYVSVCVCVCVCMSESLCVCVCVCVCV